MRATFDLVALIEETAELIAPRAQAKELEIASYVEDGLPPRVVGDAARLRQVLLNLAGNAVKFTDRGGVAIIVERGIRPGEIDILVRDTGIGIAPDEHDRIFREFEQADGGIARKFGGTGLGLSISRRIVERMGGRIAVESVPGSGATFRVALSLAPAAGPDDVSAASCDLGGMDVMIVAASAVESALMARRLTHWGARVCVAPDDKVAGALLPERDWGAVFVDHAIGRAACDALARATAAVPRRFVLVTPASRTELPALKDAGFTGYLVKPVRAASLAARMTRGDNEFERPGDNAEASGGATLKDAIERPFDPGRRGQRDQRALGALAADEARAPPDRRDQRRCRGGRLAVGARRRRTLCRRADGRAHAGLRRHRCDSSHPRGGSGRPAHADRRTDRQCF